MGFVHTAMGRVSQPETEPIVQGQGRSPYSEMLVSAVNLEESRIIYEMGL